MGTITNFEDWLDQADPVDFEEVYALYMAVQYDEKFGIFDCTPVPGKRQWLVKSGMVEDSLLLKSEREKEAFLSLIHESYCDPEMDMHEWHHYMSSMG